MALQQIATSCGFAYTNSDWSPDFIAYVDNLGRARGMALTYAEKQAMWEYGGTVAWENIVGRPDLSNIKILAFAIGNAPALTNGDTPDETFEAGTVFQFDELIGTRIQIRVVDAGLAPQAGGYSFDPATGTIITDAALADVNMFVQSVKSIPGSGSEVYLTTETGEFLTTEEGFYLILE